MVGFTAEQHAQISGWVRQHEAQVAARWAKRPSFLSRVMSKMRSR